MANRSAVVCTNKFKSGAKPSRALLTKQWIEIINLSDKSRKNANRSSKVK